VFVVDPLGGGVGAVDEDGLDLEDGHFPVYGLR
jgi:hypothetical protein